LLSPTGALSENNVAIDAAPKVKRYVDPVAAPDFKPVIHITYVPKMDAEKDPSVEDDVDGIVAMKRRMLFTLRADIPLKQEEETADISRVPEPASLGVLFAGATLLLMRRRR
jgi:hypothetical protein